MRNLKHDSAYLRAKNRVDRLKGFFTHLTVYIVINIAISVMKVWRNLSHGETFEEAFFEFETFSVWTFWGIGIALHAFSVFGLPLILGSNWEERKIKKFMEEEDHKTWN